VRIFDGIEELIETVGTHLGHSPWHVVSQEQVAAFAAATGDHQWIHVDPIKAAAGPFGRPIAHGYLTLSLVPMLVWQVFDVSGVQMAVNYGVNKVRFPAPVPVGSRVRAGVEIVSVGPVGDAYHATSKVTIECDAAAKPACVVETVTLLVP
jgi:acyl dehydratase